MTKNEFISRLALLLERKHISDAGEIISEYEQHFAFKLADGFSEEEIAAKLGDPEQIAEQYENSGSAPVRTAPFTKIGLYIADFFAGIFFLLLALAGIVIAVAVLVFAAVGVCLLLGISPWSLIPSMPYWCGAILGLAMLALAVLTAVGSLYYWVFWRQFLRSFARFHRNTLAAAAGKPALPSLPVHAQFEPRFKRRLRTIALIALAAFATCFVLGYIACALSAGSLQFYHVWGWFGFEL